MTLFELKDCKTLEEIAKMLPHNPTKQTVWGWVKKGIKVQGRTVKLHAERIGGIYVVPPGAIEKFMADCNPTAQPAPESEHKLALRKKSAREEFQRIVGNSS